MSIHDDIETIATLEKNIYAHVGYREQWRVFPLDDKRDMFWWSDGDIVKLCPTREKLMVWLTEDDDSGECYSNEVIRKGIYRIAYDVDRCKVGCVLIQAALGCDVPRDLFFDYFGTGDAWTVNASGCKVYPIRWSQLPLLAARTNFER